MVQQVVTAGRNARDPSSPRSHWKTRSERRWCSTFRILSRYTYCHTAPLCHLPKVASASPARNVRKEFPMPQSGLVVLIQLRCLQPAPHSKAKDPVCVNANPIPGYAAHKPTQRPSYPRQLDRSEPFTGHPMLIPISKTRFSTSS